MKEYLKQLGELIVVAVAFYGFAYVVNLATGSKLF